MAHHAGVYKHDRDENLEEFLEKRGANFLAAKMMAKMGPTVSIEVGDDGSYTIRTMTAVKNFEWHFQLGEEVALPTPDGTKTFTFSVDDDGKLIQSPSGEFADGGVVVEREFSDEGMVMTLKHEASGDEAKRFFNRE